MPRMTAKYKGAMHVAMFRPDLGIDASKGDQEALYTQLQEKGFFWDSNTKQWDEYAEEDADEPTKLVMVRVWADIEIVDDLAGDLVRAMKKKWEVVDESKVYRNRPPKQLEGRVYLKFLPRARK